ncbi:MAG: L-threonylcarbamoyladenylate synthase [Chloroflexota bacterium]
MSARTIVLTVDPEHPDAGAIERAADVLRSGGLVAFPTETVYGLGASAFDDVAVRRVFAAKERAADDPLIVHVADPSEVARVARRVPSTAQVLMESFWPGALTLVLEKLPVIPDSATAGRDSVAVRCPSLPLVHRLIQVAGVPLVAPSANRFTRTSATEAAHVLADLDGRIDLVLDGGPTPIGIESTVVDARQDPPVLLRAGAVTVEALEQDLLESGRPALAFPSTDAAGVAPGQMLKHYAPRARLEYFQGSRDAALQAMDSEARALLETGKRVGALLCAEDAGALDRGVALVIVGKTGDLPAIARSLFAALRRLDDAGLDVILVHDFGGDGLGRAIRDRLTRAASGRVRLAE